MEIGNSKRLKKRNWPPAPMNKMQVSPDPFPVNGDFTHEPKDLNTTPTPQPVAPSFTASRVMELIRHSRLNRMALFPGDMAGYNAGNPENPGNLQQGQTGPGAALGEPPQGTQKEEGYEWLTDLDNAFKRYVSRNKGKRTLGPTIIDQTHLDAAGD